MIIALTGKKGSGKSTVADMLDDEYGFDQYAFSTPMKEFCAKVFGWGWEELYGSRKEIIDPTWGLMPRKALQSIGTNWAQFILGEYDDFAEVTGRLIWVRYFMREYYWPTDWVISDVRFPHEVAGLMEIGTPVHVVRVERDHDDADPHASEQEMDSIKAEVIIRNTGSIEELGVQVDAMVRRFMGGGAAMAKV